MFTTYIPRPTVEAVEITEEALPEIAEHFGVEHEEGTGQVVVDLPLGDGQVIRMGLAAGAGAVLVRHGADNYSVIPEREFHAVWIADHS